MTAMTEASELNLSTEEAANPRATLRSEGSLQSFNRYAHMQRWRISIHFEPVKHVPDLVTGLLITFSDDHPPPDSHAK